MYVPDVCITPYTGMSRTQRFQRVGPPRKWLPAAVERLGNDVLVCKAGGGDGGGGVKKVNELFEGGRHGLEDNETRVEKVAGARAVFFGDGWLVERFSARL